MHVSASSPARATMLKRPRKKKRRSPAGEVVHELERGRRRRGRAAREAREARGRPQRRGRERGVRVAVPEAPDLPRGADVAKVDGRHLRRGDGVAVLHAAPRVRRGPPAALQEVGDDELGHPGAVVEPERRRVGGVGRRRGALVHDVRPVHDVVPGCRFRIQRVVRLRGPIEGCHRCLSQDALQHALSFEAVAALARTARLPHDDVAVVIFFLRTVLLQLCRVVFEHESTAYEAKNIDVVVKSPDDDSVQRPPSFAATMRWASALLIDAQPAMRSVAARRNFWPKTSTRGL